MKNERSLDNNKSCKYVPTYLQNIVHKKYASTWSPRVPCPRVFVHEKNSIAFVVNPAHNTIKQMYLVKYSAPLQI